MEGFGQDFSISKRSIMLLGAVMIFLSECSSF